MARILVSSSKDQVCRPLPRLSEEQAARYRHFRALLDHNRAALTIMAELEQIYYDNRPLTPQAFEREFGRLLGEMDGIVQSMQGMSGQEQRILAGLLGSIRRTVRDELKPNLRSVTEALILPLAEVEPAHAMVVGGKAANLAFVHKELEFRVPRGFAVTTRCYENYLQPTGVAAAIDACLADLTADDPVSLEATGREIRTRILDTPLPESIRLALEEAVRTMRGHGGADLLLAVRSSAIGEDSETSFAGQYTSVLNVTADRVAQAYQTVVASKYTASALAYRMHHGLDDRETPMAVLVLEMVQPRLSGVLYTADPLSGDRAWMHVNAVRGVAEGLVGGGVSAERSYRLGRESFRVAEAQGTEDTSEPSLSQEDEELLRSLWESARRLEAHFRRPLDVEWAVDDSGRLFLLQVRPLLILEVPKAKEESPDAIFDDTGHPLLLEGGKCASGGVAAGKVLVLMESELPEKIERLEPDTILVTRTASTALTPLIGNLKGVVTDIGSVTSHLASVAREFGVPALFDTRRGTANLRDGDEITLWASRGRIYRGIVEDLVRGLHQVKRPFFASPAHLRLQRLLDSISPLNLTDTRSPEFAPEGCITVHDIIRFCHEQAMREMFSFSKVAGRNRNAVQLKVSIPIQLYALDLGGGLRQGLTTCDEVDPHEVSSVPFRALWRGLSHPGINWTGTVALGAHNFLSLVAGGAMPQPGNQLGGASFAVVSEDYLNLNARFGYHFATVDALCGENADHNYLSLHFAGGAGSYFGRSLRLQYLAGVLKRLGFSVDLKGDLIEASLGRLDRTSMEDALDQLGRLLGTSRLLDMAMSSPEQALNLVDAFFRGEYNFLEPGQEDAPADFYLITGQWQKSGQDQEPGVLQDGSRFGSWVSAKLAQAMGRLMGKKYQEFLDNAGAYYYFPLAIAKDSFLTEGTLELGVKPIAGHVDQAGGLAFAIRDWGNYFVFRVNALEDNVILFEFKNGKRLQRLSVDRPIRTGDWRRLRVETSGRCIRGYLDGELVLEYQAERSLEGYVGLWTKADSVTLFQELTWESSDGEEKNREASVHPGG